MRGVRLVIVALAAAVFATDVAAAPAAEPPMFPWTMSYAHVRQQMIRRGYDPQPIVSREDGGDDAELEARSAKWPEVKECSVDGFCNFLFRRRRDGRYATITTWNRKHDMFRGSSWTPPSDLSELVLGPIPGAPASAPPRSAPRARLSGGR